MNAPPVAAAILAFVGIACASRIDPSREAQWKDEWNARVDAADSRWENPCGDPEFDPWATQFLAACEPQERLPGAECAQRRRWVEARVEQCDAWQAFLLRNHGKRERIDETPEPPTRVE